METFVWRVVRKVGKGLWGIFQASHKTKPDGSQPNKKIQKTKQKTWGNSKEIKQTKLYPLRKNIQFLMDLISIGKLRI